MTNWLSECEREAAQKGSLSFFSDRQRAGPYHILLFTVDCYKLAGETLTVFPQ